MNDVKTARKALEQYFAGRRELCARRDADLIDNLNFLIKLNHDRKQLGETNWTAFLCVHSVERIIDPFTFMDYKDAERIRQIGVHERQKIDSWMKKWWADNFEQLTFKLLEMAENLVVPTLPIPDPIEVEKSLKIRGFSSDYIEKKILEIIGDES